MPKDTDKYRYLTVGLAWDSEVLQQLEADANKHQMGDQLAKMIALRITEYYELVKRGVVVPGITLLTQQPSPDPPTVKIAALPTDTRVRKSSPPLSEPIVVPESARVGANASAALIAFMDDEDEE
jgi:hypothetical protein